MSDIQYFTKEGLEKIKHELHFLKTEERTRITQAIAEARDKGDLSENAEYAAAREKQSFIEGRIEELDAKTSRADVIDPKKLSGDKAVFGAHVTVVDEDTEQEITYQLVGVDEADIHQCRLSITAPLGKALIGKKKGDSVEVRTPGGVKAYAVLKIAFIG